jgi:hypothetical protein
MIPENGDSPSAEKAPRHRSPNYPGISLKTAVEKITTWYKADGIVASPKEAAMKHMSGDIGRVISALKSFGLVSETEGRIKLEQRGIDIVARSADDPKRKQALKDAILSPAIYRDLVKEYPNGLPSDITLGSELVAGKKFNPKSVDDFIKDLKSSLVFSGIGPSAVLDSKEDDESNGEENPVSQASVLEPVVEAMPIKPKAEAESIQKPPLPAKREYIQPPPANVRQDVFSIEEGAVTVQWPASLSPESIEDISAWLEILKRKIGRSVANTGKDG